MEARPSTGPRDSVINLIPQTAASIGNCLLNAKIRDFLPSYLERNSDLAQRYIILQTKLSSLDESLGLLDCIGIFPPLEPLAYAQCDIKGREGFHFDFG